jgi:oligopeptide/dipeptide ABC transporter ATP-binding protein
MYAGEVVESGTVEEALATPQHPYTNGLLGAVPRLNSDVATLVPIMGRVPQPNDLPPGCSFADRCGRVLDVCRAERPHLEVRRHSEVRCYNPVG